MAFLYTWPDTSWHPNAAWSGGLIDGTPWEDPLYPANNMRMSDPSAPTRMTCPGSLIATFDAPVTLEGFALIGHTFDESSGVWIQGSTNSTFTALVLEEPVLVGMTRRADGTGVNPWADWRSMSAAARTARYWRLLATTSGAVVDGTALVGMLWMPQQWRYLYRGVQWESTRERTRLGVQHRTEGGARFGYDYGITVRKLHGSTMADYGGTQDDGPPYGERDYLEDWWDACRGGLRPMVIVPDDTDTWSGAWYVTWDSLSHTHTRSRGRQAPFPLDFEEVPLGVWVTADA